MKIPAIGHHAIGLSAGPRLHLPRSIAAAAGGEDDPRVMLPPCGTSRAVAVDPLGGRRLGSGGGTRNTLVSHARTSTPIARENQRSRRDRSQCDLHAVDLAGAPG